LPEKYFSQILGERATCPSPISSAYECNHQHQSLLSTWQDTLVEDLLDNKSGLEQSQDSRPGSMPMAKSCHLMFQQEHEELRLSK